MKRFSGGSLGRLFVGAVTSRLETMWNAYVSLVHWIYGPGLLIIAWPVLVLSLWLITLDMISGYQMPSGSFLFWVFVLNGAIWIVMYRR